VALGFAVFPVAKSVDVEALPNGWRAPYQIFMLTCFFMLPMAGVGSLIGHTTLFIAMGVVGALVIFVMKSAF
jgi:hypothetical protein